MVRVDPARRFEDWRSLTRHVWAMLSKHAPWRRVPAQYSGQHVDEMADKAIEQMSATILEQLNALPVDRALLNPHQTLMDLAARASKGREAPLPAIPRIQSAIDELPAMTRLALDMHVNRNLSYKQIAGELGMSPEVALGRLKVAYAHLRQRLARQTTKQLSS